MVLRSLFNVLHSPREAALYWSALRPFSFPASLLPVLVGTAAAAPMRDWRWGVLGVCLATAALLHGFGNLMNDYFDFRSGVDRRMTGDEGRPGRFLVRGEMLPRDTLRLALLCLVLLVPAAAFIIWRGGWPVAALMAAGLLGGFLYTGGPYPLKYHALGELNVFLVFGPAAVCGAAYMQADRFALRALLAALPLGMSIAAILAANNLRDADEDAAGGIRTLAAALGQRAYRGFYLFLLFGAPTLVGALCATGELAGWALLSLCALPLALGPARDALASRRRPDADAVAAHYMTAFGLLLFAGLAISGL